ncbi:MAG: hypothetical protein AAGG48_23045 [Planctomycetota bacterium]
MRTLKLYGLIAFVGLFAIGCENSQLAGGKYLLNVEPADPQTPTRVKESVAEPTRMVVAGRVEAGDIEPFQDGVATFVMTQLPDEAHAGGDPDHVENCPFCQRELRNAPKAIVRILDESGEVMSVDARELLGVSKGDVVVVEGLVTYLEPVNTVQIDAEGIFIR